MNFRTLKFSNKHAYTINFDKIKYMDLYFEIIKIPLMSGDINNLKETGIFYFGLKSYLEFHLDDEILTFRNCMSLLNKNQRICSNKDYNYDDMKAIEFDLLVNKCDLLAEFLSVIQNSYPTSIVTMKELTIKIEKFIEHYDIYSATRDDEDDSCVQRYCWSLEQDTSKKGAKNARKN